MIRSFLGYSFLIVYLLYSVPILWRVIYYDKHNKITERDALVHKTVQRWARTFVNFTKSDIRISGEENIPKDTAVLFVGNHQSIFDMLILLGYLNRPIAFIAKIEASKLPILNKWMKYMNCVFIERTNVRQSLHAINQGAEYMKKGYSFVIFPEGTRTVNGELIDFKPGSFKLAVKAGAPIVPIAFKDSYKIMGKNKILFQAAKVDVVILPPVYIEKDMEKDTKQIAEAVRDMIKGELNN